MEKTVSYFKVSLAFKSDKHQEGVNFDKITDDLCGAKDEYNSIENDSCLVLLKPSPKRLNLLLKVGSQEQDFNLSLIKEFIGILMKDYDWSAYCCQKGELFSVKSSKKVNHKDCKILLERLRRSDPYLFDSYDCTLLLNENIVAESDKDKYQDLGLSRDKISDRENPEDEERKHKGKPKYSFIQTIRNINNLVGLDDCKKELKQIYRAVKHISRFSDKTSENISFPYHYLFTMDNPGSGLTTILGLMASMLYYAGACKRCEVTEFSDNKDSFFPFYKLERVQGVMSVRNIDQLGKENSTELDKFMEKILSSSDRGVIAFSMCSQEDTEINTIKEKLEAKVSLRHIHIPDYSSVQLTEITKIILGKYGFRLSARAEEFLNVFIDRCKEGMDLKNVHLAEWIVTKITADRLFDLEQKTIDHIINVKDLSKVLRFEEKENEDVDNSFLYSELESLIGIDEVKKRVKEIASHLEISSRKAQMGVEGHQPSYHMMFTGNPGTGKTTVAKILGKVFKKLGLISKGDFIEATREDFVARYVGHTALKTKSKLEEARGNILFIDEAYSLDGGQEYDFGREALATIVKEMEEHRDDMVVILAGYTEEMEGLLKVNPGLKHRIAHRIEFPDYGPEELLSIFTRELGEGYELEKNAADKLLKLFKNACSNADKSFGNGRFARTVAERVLTKQSIRLSQLDQLSREDIFIIKSRDVDEIFNDSDIIPYSYPAASTRKIGFIRY